MTACTGEALAGTSAVRSKETAYKDANNEAATAYSSTGRHT